MNDSNQQTWFYPYARPTASTTILEEEEYFNESMSPLFDNIRHPFNPQYKYNNIAGETNHNMLEGQPEYQRTNFYSNYINQNEQQKYKKLGLLANSKSKEANIHWNNGAINNKKFEYNPYQINPEFKALPDGQKHFNNPHTMKGPLTQIIPWDMFSKLDKNDDEYFNERNFQEIYNHPFYNNMKPFLEQPFKYL
jgi:hypothetical protein